MTAREPLLRVSDLAIAFADRDGSQIRATHGVEFHVNAGETLGIVGESGCGKSISLRSLLGIVPPPGAVVAGAAVWEGDRDLLALAPRELREVRGKQIAMIFQDPQESLDPSYSIGDQLVEVLTKRAGRSRGEARKEAVSLLERVGIPAAQRRLRAYPHQLSGGMRQRVMIAMAISCKPALLLADEPTTALDVTVQDQILTLLSELQEELGMAMIVVSHDLGVIGQTSDRVAVMYAGRVVETGSADQVLLAPRHPYTTGLLAAVPRFAAGEARAEAAPIPGQPPTLSEQRDGCAFAPRCRHVQAGCEAIAMVMDQPPDGHRSACPKVDAAGSERIVADVAE